MSASLQGFEPVWLGLKNMVGGRARQLAALVVLALLAVPLSGHNTLAGALDSVPNDPEATMIHEDDSVVVPPNGAVGAVVQLSGRAFLSIDFAVQSGRQLTLIVLTGAQKQEMDAGMPISGRPRVRTPIDGTASQSVTVVAGGYYVAILNSYPEPVSVTYRVSARAY